jgi:hypothetical protein
MSILTAVALKALHLPPFSFGKWMKFSLGRPLSDLIKAYTRAVSIPYSVAWASIGKHRPPQSPGGGTATTEV